MLRRFTPPFQLVMPILLALLALLLVGCEALGTPAPQTTAQRIATTVASVTAVRESTRTLLVARKISPDDAANVQVQADNVIAGAQIARSLLTADPAAADAKLQQTQAVLLALQAYLATKEKTR